MKADLKMAYENDERLDSLRTSVKGIIDVFLRRKKAKITDITIAEIPEFGKVIQFTGMDNKNEVSFHSSLPYSVEDTDEYFTKVIEVCKEIHEEVLEDLE